MYKYTCIRSIVAQSNLFSIQQEYKKIKTEFKKVKRENYEEKRVARARTKSQQADALIRVFPEFRIPLCFAGQFVISAGSAAEYGGPAGNVGGGRGRRRTSQDVKDGDTGVEEGSMGRAGCGEVK